MKQVYFIERGLVSVTARINRETAVEVWLIGREGMTGVPVVLGGDFAPPHRRVVQVGGSALRIASRDLQRLMGESGVLRKVLLRYAQAILLQASQIGACNAHHSLQERLARWLLIARARACSTLNLRTGIAFWPSWMRRSYASGSPAVSFGIVMG